MEQSATLVIDFHTHIFPPEMIRDREKFFPGEPEFQLLYGSPKSKIIPAEVLIESMDRHGIDRSVVFGFPWRSDHLLRRHNEYVIESSGRFPDRLVPLACLDLFAANIIELAADYVNAVSGFGELAIYSDSQSADLAFANFMALSSLCREKSRILLVHANEPVGHAYPGKAPFGLDLYYSMADAAAGVPLILAHWGGGLFFYELLKKEASERLANVYYDTAASPFLYKSGIYKIAALTAGSGKILFGSDFPLISPERYLSEVAQSGLTESEVSAVLGDNAARLLSLE